MSAHLAHPTHPDIPKVTLPHLFPQAPQPADHPWPVEPLPGSSEEGKDKGSWVFEDTNAATNLMRNALGGDDRRLRNRKLSCTGYHARQMRDEPTVM